MTKISEMGTKTLVACAIVLGLMAGPSMAAENAHHYQGGPRTSIPHLTKHPGSDQPVAEKRTARKQNAHRYQGGPQFSAPHSVR
jgi:hypothetical protein